MSATDLLRLAMRLLHSAALVAWLGSGLAYALVRARLTGEPGAAARAELGRLLGRVARPAFALLLASGVYLMFDRLADPRLGPLYVAVLALKLLLVAASALIGAGGRGARKDARAVPGRIALLLAPRRPELARRRAADRTAIVLGLGGAALGLGVALGWLYELERAARR